MADFIDLVEFCKGHSNKLSNVRVYGRITGTMPEPRSLRQDVVVDSDCVCCNMDLVAVNLSNYSEELSVLGLSSPDNIYFVNGSVSVFVDKTTVLDDWYSCDGSLRLAARSRNASVMAMFNFFRIDDKWGIHKTNTLDLEVTDFKSPDSRIMDYIRQGDSLGKVIIPEDIATVTKFYSEEPDALNLAVEQGLLDNFGINRSFNSEVLTIDTVTSIESDSSLSYTPHDNFNFGSGLSNLCVVSDIAFESRKHFIDFVRSNFPYTGSNEHIKYMCGAIKTNFAHCGTQYSLTGKQLIKGYLISCGVDINLEYLGVPLWSFISSSIKEILSCMLTGNSFEATGLGKEIVDSYFSCSEMLYAGILGEVTGLSSISLVNVAKSLKAEEVSFSRVINENPYLLSLFSDILTVEELEYLALCFGKAESTALSIAGKTVQEYRNIAVVLQYMRNSYPDDTYMFKSELNGKVLGTVLTFDRYDKVKQKGYYLSYTRSFGLCTYFSRDLNEKSWSYSSDIKWLRVRNGYIRALSDIEIKTALSQAIQIGLVLQFTVADNECISYWSKLTKELTCYRVLNDMSKNTVTYDEAFVDKYISEFESIKNISLSEDQKNAVKLIRNRAFAIDGLIGTGKHTVIECIDFVLSKLTIGYSSRRYSLASEPGFESIDNSKLYNLFNTKSSDTDSVDCYIINAAELATIDDIYAILTIMSSMSRVIFVGDIEGVTESRGVFFRDILGILPCVRLSAIESVSGIPALSKNLSNAGVLSENSSCKFINCDDSEIPVITQLLCKYHIGTINDNELALLQSKIGSNSFLSLDKLASREIQVVSPVESPDFSWGCYNMNNILRGVFNTSDNSVFIWGTANKRFSMKLGDRVIHTQDGNDFQRYETFANGILKKSSKTGVSAGSVGVVVGYLPTSRCIFQDSSEHTVNINAVRNDTKFCGNNKYFIVVRYYDSIEKQGYYILYRAYLDTNCNSDCIAFNGGDADCIQLHYCSTIQRVSGVRNKLVISLLGNMGGNEAVTRNMLYSHWRTAELGLYIIGDVSNNANSQLSKSKAKASYISTRTLGGIVCK